MKRKYEDVILQDMVRNRIDCLSNENKEELELYDYDDYDIDEIVDKILYDNDFDSMIIYAIEKYFNTKKSERNKKK